MVVSIDRPRPAAAGRRSPPPPISTCSKRNAFGNYRTLLQQVSLARRWAMYLTFRGNAKANAATGALPDENYARELMQLFTIGLVQLNLDGTPRSGAGSAAETYDPGRHHRPGARLHRLGLRPDRPRDRTTRPTSCAGRWRRSPAATRPAPRPSSAPRSRPAPPADSADDGARHDLRPPQRGAVHRPPADPAAGHQQPEPGLCRARRAVFDNNGSRRARQPEGGGARDPARRRGAQRQRRPRARRFGKLREPVLRFDRLGARLQRHLAGGAWAIGDTSDPATRLGQSPLRSPSVFNFFRPGYVPPNSAIAAAGAGRARIPDHQRVVGGRLRELHAARGARQRRRRRRGRLHGAAARSADDAPALVDELNLVLAAGQLVGRDR